MDKYSLFWFLNLLGWWHHRNDLFILYYIYIILFIQDHIYIYNILYMYTGLHILWCEHVSSRIAGSRLFLNEHSDIIHFTQINMHHSNLPFVCCCRYNHPVQFDWPVQHSVWEEYHTSHEWISMVYTKFCYVTRTILLQNQFALASVNAWRLWHLQTLSTAFIVLAIGK